MCTILGIPQRSQEESTRIGQGSGFGPWLPKSSFHHSFLCSRTFGRVPVWSGSKASSTRTDCSVCCWTRPFRTPGLPHSLWLPFLLNHCLLSSAALMPYLCFSLCETTGEPQNWPTMKSSKCPRKPSGLGWWDGGLIHLGQFHQAGEI